MNRFLVFSILFFASCSAFSQTGQLTITRVTSMANQPAPYVMRDWKQVAVRYDSTIYNATATGQFLPLIHFKSSGVNYPSVQPILIPSYVGGDANSGEAINILPSLVGATLNGVNKANQNGVNYVEKAKDFFNKANGENVYLNGYSSGSGSDWWYDLMPNVFFYQLYTQYPNTPDFADQFIAIADRQLQVVTALGGKTTPFTAPNMNYRGIDLLTMTPNSAPVSEPESAGTIAWILYHAYEKTGDKKYLDGAQLAMTFLTSLTANPAYELQLPYGSFIAAKMNAETGTSYNISKLINWSFDLSSKRNWGTVVGQWGDASTGGLNDVSGLVGEIDNPNTGYAFTLNGFQQASALVPLVKYDKRFAHDIGKWMLNLANASRLYYSKYLPSDHQDQIDYTWGSAHDPNSNIAFESLKQTRNGKLLYATGDAELGGWAPTNLGLYGSSSVGYLGAIVNTSNISEILLLDANKTDFFGQNAFPTFIVYNPYTTLQSVTIPFGSGSFDVYDAISETFLKTNVSGSTQIDVAANSVRLLSYLPASTTTAVQNGKLMAGANVVDYHYGYDFSPKLKIRSLGVADTTVGFGQAVKVYSSVINKPSAATYSWYANGTLVTSSADSVLTWTVPSIAGPTNLVLKVTAGAQTAKDSIEFNVIDHLPIAPLVTGITADSAWYFIGSLATLTCNLDLAETSPVTYTWTLPSSGSIISINGNVAKYEVPDGENIFVATCKVTKPDGLSTTATYNILVKNHSSEKKPVAYFPLDGDTKDYSGNGHDATATGVKLTEDARGISSSAYLFDGIDEIIDVPNVSSLNFADAITLSFWVKPTSITKETFVVSHGSYEQRWKASIIYPDKKMRWTVKTSSGVADLDSSEPLTLNTYYHFTVVFSGYSMEIYRNGILDQYIRFSGSMPAASVDLTFGRKDPVIRDYNLLGSIDEVRIYDKVLNPKEIKILPTLYNSVTGLEGSQQVEVYPNPAHGSLRISGLGGEAARFQLIDLTGRALTTQASTDGKDYRIEYTPSSTGLLLLKIETPKGVSWKKIISN